VTAPTAVQWFAIADLRVRGADDALIYNCARCGAIGDVSGVSNVATLLDHHEAQCPGEPQDDDARIRVECIAEGDDKGEATVLPDPRSAE